MRIVGLFDEVPAAARGTGPDAANRFPYRVDLLREHGIQLSHSKPALNRWHRKIRDVLEHRTGLPMDLAIRALPGALRAEATLAFLESRALFPGLMRRFRIPPYGRIPLAVISCWWAEELVNGSEEQRSRIRAQLADCSLIFFFSENQREIFRTAGVPDERLRYVPFGVDNSFYTPADVPKRFQVFAAGVDRGRDYETLMDAARRMPNVQFSIVTKPDRIEAAPQNVELLPLTDMPGHRGNLRAAQFVVVPTHSLAYPTGQSVMLEAMACGRPVAVTSTPAMQDYLMEDVQLPLPLHDGAGVAEVLEAALADPVSLERRAERGLRLVEERFNFSAMWAHVAEELHACRRRSP